MSVLGKVSARAGMQWVLGSLLLRCAPLALDNLPPLPLPRNFLEV